MFLIGRVIEIMDNEDFENIYKNPKEEDNKAPGSDLLEKVVLTDEEEQERWYELDSGNPESFIEYKNFSWQRKKSNANTEQDPNDGKGFSFYYAIHAFDDPNYVYTIPDENHLDEDNGKRALSMGPDPFDKAVIVVINIELEDGKLRIISAWKASAKNDVEHYRMYENHRRIIDNLKNKTRVVESTSSTYYVLRKAIGKSFDENSYGIVADSNDVSEPIDRIATYNGKKVYVQKIGSKPECERLAEMIKFGLDHYKRGKTW